ncbi:hypothetical protein BGZ79_004400, partial [Entomortierella chlamydospora]
SLALLSTAVLAMPTSPCHDNSGPAAVLGETHKQAAGLARNLVKDTGIGTFMSVMDGRQMDGSLNGYPFGSMDYYVDDCDAPGTPLMLLSHLQVNVQNARTTNRVSLAIRKAEECFVKQHPEAKWWLPRNGFHDFKWYQLEIKEIYYIGGFGGIHYIGWIDVETYYKQQQQEEEEQEQEHLDSFWHFRQQ